MPFVQSVQRLNKTLFFVSFLIVAFAQPDWSPFACILTSALGYALFWRSIAQTTHRFWWGVLWFGTIQALHLSWFTADRYVGVYIFFFLSILFFSLGVQFGLITLLVRPKETLSPLRLGAIAGAWTLLEWSRLFVLSGFSWNPIGLALSGTVYSMQLAAVIGTFGLSFWIILTNLLALNCLTIFSWQRCAMWSVGVVAPFLFGFLHYQYHSIAIEKGDSKLNALLVQTALIPEEKMSLNGSLSISPFIQWQRILNMMTPYLGKPVDIIILSEAVVPYGTDHPVYPHVGVVHSFQTFFQRIDFLPKVENEKVGNCYWAQSVANLFDADVVIGLEDYKYDQKSAPAYNAGFFFTPHSEGRCRYEKRILVPLGEYIPFNWCRTLLSKYGIAGSFSKGVEAKVFPCKKAPLAMSICYEETYGHLMRESRLKGAALLVNLSNDVWYPSSRLPMVHFLHGRLRSVETGLPLLRSCNTGVTCGVDSLGRTIAMLPYEKSGTKSVADALYLSLPLYHYTTLYTIWGDWFIVLISVSVLFLFCMLELKRFKLDHL